VRFAMIDTSPNSLKDSNASLKVKTSKEGVEVRELKARIVTMMMMIKI
jgi:hypothetical protein